MCKMALKMFCVCYRVSMCVQTTLSCDDDVSVLRPPAADTYSTIKASARRVYESQTLMCHEVP